MERGWRRLAGVCCSLRVNLIRCCALLLVAMGGVAFAEESASRPAVIEPASGAVARFRERARPVLEAHCFDCHGNGAREGGRAFDGYASEAELVGDVKLWLAVLRNVRSGIMPPAEEERLTAEERRQLFEWIERDAFGIDPANIDPGRFTLRRLNRAEYRNTVRDLTGVDYDTSSEFPPDDGGYGFDNIGDAMSVSPLVMEKYLAAARAVAAEMKVELPAAKAAEGGSNKAPSPRPSPIPSGSEEAAAREFLQAFVRRAYRRPVDEATVERLAAVAKSVYAMPGQTVEEGLRAAVAAVLASPRFLFRVEEPVRAAGGERRPLVDEYALASRLSYFLWSTMPDEELSRRAERGELRANIAATVARMLKDRRAEAVAENFAGQWLRARDIEHADINAAAVLGVQPKLDEIERQLRKLREQRERELAQEKRGEKEQSEGTNKFAQERSATGEDRERLRSEYRRLKEAAAKSLDDKLRRAMREETEQSFAYVVRENRDVLELVDADYAFVNAALARHYGIEGVEGSEVRRVTLPAGSPRGGVLAQATILVVTSNPGRTSPVKRGLYILNNILGYPPPPPPPPNIPPLEAAAEGVHDGEPTVRELQERHRRDPLCSSCHARMDPLGLALENFNALGMWREEEHGRPIDASGKLLTGEEFRGIRDLKRIIREQHRLDFYRCLTEKLLTYALGRGLEYYDEVTVDRIVEQLDREGGKFSALVIAIVESAPFQRMRRER